MPTTDPARYTQVQPYLSRLATLAAEYVEADRGNRARRSRDTPSLGKARARLEGFTEAMVAGGLPVTPGAVFDVAVAAAEDAGPCPNPLDGAVIMRWRTSLMTSLAHRIARLS